MGINVDGSGSCTVCAGVPCCSGVCAVEGADVLVTGGVLAISMGRAAEPWSSERMEPLTVLTVAELGVWCDIDGVLICLCLRP